MQIFSISGNESEKDVFESLIQEADTNGDGELSLKEFITMMERFMSATISNK
jgi:Ca2+-binding EF-hand superfamily protein